MERSIMIVREVLDSDSALDRFDLFNDAKDTLNWLSRIDTERARQVYMRLSRDLELFTRSFNRDLAISEVIRKEQGQ